MQAVATVSRGSTHPLRPHRFVCVPMPGTVTAPFDRREFCPTPWPAHGPRAESPCLPDIARPLRLCHCCSPVASAFPSKPVHMVSAPGQSERTTAFPNAVRTADRRKAVQLNVVLRFQRQACFPDPEQCARKSIVAARTRACHCLVLPLHCNALAPLYTPASAWPGASEDEFLCAGCPVPKSSVLWDVATLLFVDALCARLHVFEHLAHNRLRDGHGRLPEPRFVGLRAFPLRLRLRCHAVRDLLPQ